MVFATFFNFMFLTLCWNEMEMHFVLFTVHWIHSQEVIKCYLLFSHLEEKIIVCVEYNLNGSSL